MATFEKRKTETGEVVHRVKIRLKGHPSDSATFTRLTDARRWAQSTEAAIREGRHFKTSEAKRHTLGELIDRYVREVLPQKSIKTASDQETQLHWWKDQLGAYLLSDVTPVLLAEYRDRLARGEKEPRSPGTVVRYMAALSHAFSIAVREWGWVDDSPMRKVSKPREPRGRVRYLSDDERTRLLEACRASENSYLYTIVVLALSTGARKNEIMRMSWDDVDFDRQRIILHETKNGERRSLPITGHALELMRTLSRVRRIDSRLVFSRADGTAPQEIRKHWEAAREKAGLADFHFHDLRHSCASYLAMNKATLSEIAAVLGHKTLAMVKRYAHLSDGHISDVIGSMNRKIFLEGK